MAHFGGFGVAFGMMAILVAVAIVFWLGANDEFMQESSSQDGTNHDPSMQPVPLIPNEKIDEPGLTSESGIFRSSPANPLFESPLLTVSQVPLSIIFEQIARHSALKAFGEKQLVSLSNLEATSVILGETPVFEVGASVVVVQPDHQSREPDLDDVTDFQDDGAIESRSTEIATELDQDNPERNQEHTRNENNEDKGNMPDTLLEESTENKDEKDEPQFDVDSSAPPDDRQQEPQKSESKAEHSDHGKEKNDDKPDDSKNHGPNNSKGKQGTDNSETEKNKKGDKSGHNRGSR